MKFELGVWEDSPTVLALEIGIIQLSLHVSVHLACLPRFIALSTLTGACGGTKSLLAAALAESFLALTAADGLPDDMTADPALEEGV